MPGRLEYERAIRRSDLPPLTRLVALTIATWADIDTGVIPDRYQPSMNTLLEATGLSKGALLKHLAGLEASSWATVDRPTREDARTKHVRNRYSLAIPTGLGQEMTQPGSGDDPASERARSGDDPALGQEMNQAGSPADPELGHVLTPRVPSPSSPTQSPRGDGGQQPPQLRVAEAGTGSERHKANKNNGVPGQQPLLLAVQGATATPPAYDRLAELMSEHYGTPVTKRHAAAVAVKVLDAARDRPRDPLAYVMTAVRRDPARHRPTTTPPTFQQRRAAGEA